MMLCQSAYRARGIDEPLWLQDNNVTQHRLVVPDELPKLMEQLEHSFGLEPNKHGGHRKSLELKRESGYIKCLELLTVSLCTSAVHVLQASEESHPR